MSEFVLTARMMADASDLVAGAREGSTALRDLGAAAREAGAGGAGLGQATGGQAAAARQASQANDQLARSTVAAATGQQELAGATQSAAVAQTEASGAARTLATSEQAAATAGRTLARVEGQVAAGAEGMAVATAGAGATLGGLAQGMAGATSPGQQLMGVLGHVGTEAEGTGRKTSGLASIIGGGVLGTAIGIGVAALEALISSLFDTSSATDVNAASQRQAISAADALSQAQGVLGDMFDLSTGKVRNNTEAVRLNTIQVALNLRAQAQMQSIQAGATLNLAGRLPGTLSSLGIGGQPGAVADSVRNLFTRVGLTADGSGSQRAVEQAMVGLAEMERSFRRDGFNRGAVEFISQVRAALNNRVQGAAGEQIADDTLRSVLTGRLAAGLGRQGSGNSGRNGRSARARQAPDQAEFGEDAGARIRDLVGRFSDTPPQVEAVRRALSDLDDIMSDIERRRPPNWEALLAQARAARPAIERGLNKPFNDFLDQQEQSLRLMQLQAAGHEDEAEALQAILRIEQQRGPLNAAQKVQILENVRALQEQQRATEILQQRQQLYLNALAETRKTLVATVEGVLGGDFKSLLSLPKQILASFNRLTAESIVERLFGGALRQLQDQITGRDRVRQANEVYAATTETATRAVGDATDALGTFTEALRQSAERAAEPPNSGAAQNLANWNGTSTAGPDPALAWVNVFGRAAGADPALAWANVFGSRAGGTVDESGGNVVVQATPEISRNPRLFFQKMVEGLLQGLLGQQLAGLLGKAIGRGLEGAAIGGLVGGITKALGLKTSGSGAQVGGAIGGILQEFLPKALGFLGPAAPIIGGLLGGLLGGALSSTKRGSATITSVDGTASTRGNSADFISQATSMAGGIQGGLQQIADQLGGQLGSFAVSIGVRDGKIRVDPTGKGITKTKKGAVDFGDDEAAAKMFAIMDAIADGAITGLSAAVQKALQSSTDIDKALREALKVDEVETLLKGPIGAMSKQLREFEKQAAERVRIARQYGFDVLAIEKINAADRLKLEKQILEERTGALQALLDDINFGDLFEGSITDQVAKVRDQLAQAQADAEAGVDGAADRQAELGRQLIALLREGFGTAGPEFASGLDQVKSGAELVIQLEKDRLKAAQDAAAETNSQLNEANDQLAQQTSVLTGIAGGIDVIAAGIAQLTSSLGGYGGTPVGRSTNLGAIV